jgi:peptidoglycan/xylan/chitin deacetylase (PgdA/CDA1 family)
MAIKKRTAGCERKNIWYTITHMTKISIVIPALNEEKFLPGCLESLRNQDYQGEYEIIVADNGSTDDTAGIARKSGAKVVPCPDEKSVFYARQVGADAATGEIIAQADADTIYPKNWLRRIADQFASCPEGVAVAGRFIYENAPWWARLEYLGRHVVNKISSFFGCPLAVSGATLAFRRQAFLSVNGYRGLSYSPDQYGISSRLSKLGKVLYDKDLRVTTSPRAVQKPWPIVVMDLIGHTNRLVTYSIERRLTALTSFGFEETTRHLAFRLLPVVGLLISLIAYGYFVPTSPVFGKVYYEGTQRDKIVALTFDDGPNEPYTSQVLDVLASYNVKATFFVIGMNVELDPETARRILAEGHIIGNHSYSHNANHALTQFGVRDLEHAQQVIYSTLGIVPHLYRPPHGKKSPWEIEAVKKKGMIEVTWSVSANDQHALGFIGKPTPESFAKEIVDETHPEDIILLHDGYGTSHDTVQSDKSLTVKALPLIIEQLQAKGYRFVTVPGLLNTQAYNESPP